VATPPSRIPRPEVIARIAESELSKRAFPQRLSSGPILLGEIVAIVGLALVMKLVPRFKFIWGVVYAVVAVGVLAQLTYGTLLASQNFVLLLGPQLLDKLYESFVESLSPSLA